MHLPEMDIFQTIIRQIVVGSLVDVSLCLDPVVIRQSIDLVDEHLKLDVGVDSEGFRNSGVEFGKGICVFIL